MNTLRISLRRVMLSTMGLATAGILFTSCLKNKDDNNSNIPSAGLMAINLAPEQNALVITLSGNVLTQQPLAFSNYTGGYLPIYTGSRTIESYNYSTGSRLAVKDQTFEADKYYSLYVIGKDSSYRNVVATDNFDSLSSTSGNAYIRYINAVPDSINTPGITIGAGSYEVVNENAAYGVVSEFKAATPGTVTIAVKNGEGSIDASRSITVEQKKVYTVLVSGLPGATNETQKVQIRYIVNGTLTEDTKN